MTAVTEPGPAEDAAAAPAGHREHARVVLHHAPSAAGAARRFVRNHLCSAHAAGALDTVLVVVSELVANAVTHGHPPVVLTVLCNVDQVVVGVHDSSDGVPSWDGRVIPWHAEDGRGMQLVEGLSVHWGVRRGGPTGGAGKGVWATVLLEPPR